MTLPHQPLLLSLLVLAATARADPSCAAFDRSTLSFEGSPRQQAACLLRAPQIRGRLDHQPVVLPAPLDTLIGTTPSMTKASFRAFLQEQSIVETDIGGALDEPVSHALSGAVGAPEAAYFVIHDTSTPNLGQAPFSRRINTADWPFNHLPGYRRDTPIVLPGCVKSPDPDRQPGAHVYINRVGESVSPVDFQTPWRATKFESADDCRAKGLFLHVELIQPRRSDPRGARGNDALAPNPGFTQSQYRRLAIVYAAASLRKGSWMIPAFHADLDEGISDGHDDPQHFSLKAWSIALSGVLRELQ